MTRIAPSVLGADFSRLAEEIKDADDAGVDLFHLDIMDGHFVPNISFGPAIVKTIDALTDKFLSVHLMLSEPERYFVPFLDAGADSITFHIEVHSDPVPQAVELKRLGIQAGISLNPDTDVKKVLPYLEHFDTLLVMSVFPGFGGQTFVESALTAIEEARRFIDRNKLPTEIAVDGGVDGDNAARVVSAGADTLVVGTAFFECNDKKSLAGRIQALRKS